MLQSQILQLWVLFFTWDFLVFVLFLHLVGDVGCPFPLSVHCLLSWGVGHSQSDSRVHSIHSPSPGGVDAVIDRFRRKLSCFSLWVLGRVLRRLK